MSGFRVFGAIVFLSAIGLLATGCDSPSRHDCDRDGHVFGNWVVTTYPTCTEPGEEKGICIHDATHTTTRPIDPLGPDWGEWEETLAPTEISWGERERVCQRCGVERETEPLPPTQDCETHGHHWGPWILTSPPTVTEYGLETRTCVRDPAHIETRDIPPVGGFLISSAASNYTLAVRAEGTLWAWGANSMGQFGDGMGGDFTDDHNSRVPLRVGSGTEWAYVAAGMNHVMGIKKDGTLWSWGNNSMGQLGTGPEQFHYFDPDHPEWGGFYMFVNSNVPVQVEPGTTWTSVSAGALHTVAIKTDGTLWVWGSNWVGQLGTGPSGFRYFDPDHPELGGVDVFEDRYIPVQIEPGTTWISAVAGSMQTLAVRADGTLWGWGSNTWGQLGDGTTENRGSPVHIAAGTTWRSVSSAVVHTIGIREDGTLWAWGCNEYGRTGLGTTTGYTMTPTQLLPGTTWTSVSAGDDHALAIRTDGTLWVWGSNVYGRTGIGRTTGTTATPLQVLRGLPVIHVSAGQLHTVAIRSDGTFWAWGNNGQGQLGDGTITNRNIPVQINVATD